MNAELTAEETQALQIMREIVAEKGADYVYPDELRDEDGNCVYFMDDKPCCIVGHYMTRTNYPRGEVRESWSATVHFGASKVGHALRDAQYVQDSGGSWGDALKVFKESLNVAEDES